MRQTTVIQPRQFERRAGFRRPAPGSPVSEPGTSNRSLGYRFPLPATRFDPGLESQIRQEDCPSTYVEREAGSGKLVAVVGLYGKESTFHREGISRGLIAATAAPITGAHRSKESHEYQPEVACVTEGVHTRCARSAACGNAARQQSEPG